MVLRYKEIYAFDNYKTMKIIYIMYRADEISVHRACWARATQPYPLGGGGTIYRTCSRPAGVTFTLIEAEITAVLLLEIIWRNFHACFQILLISHCMLYIKLFKL